MKFPIGEPGDAEVSCQNLHGQVYR